MKYLLDTHAALWLVEASDRLICATALEHRLTLITHDQEITRWRGVPIAW